MWSIPQTTHDNQSHCFIITPGTNGFRNQFWGSLLKTQAGKGGGKAAQVAKGTNPCNVIHSNNTKWAPPNFNWKAVWEKKHLIISTIPSTVFIEHILSSRLLNVHFARRVENYLLWNSRKDTYWSLSLVPGTKLLKPLQLPKWQH